MPEFIHSQEDFERSPVIDFTLAERSDRRVIESAFQSFQHMIKINFHQNLIEI